MSDANDSGFEFVGDERNDEQWFEAVPDSVLKEIYTAGYKECELDVREDSKSTESVIDRKWEQFKEAKLRGR